MHGQKNIKLYNAELRLEGKQNYFTGSMDRPRNHVLQLENKSNDKR